MGEDNLLTVVLAPVTVAGVKAVPRALREGMERARHYYQAAVAATVNALACRVMMGFELLAVSAALGVKNGGRRPGAGRRKESESGFPDSEFQSNKKISPEPGLISDPPSAEDFQRLKLDDVFGAYGISRTVGMEAMQMARAAHEKLDFLRSLPLLEVAPSALPMAQQQEMVSSLQKVCAGKTQLDFFGLLGFKRGPSAPAVQAGHGPRPQASRREQQAADLRRCMAALRAHWKAKHWCYLNEEELPPLEMFFRKCVGDLKPVKGARRP